MNPLVVHGERNVVLNPLIQGGKNQIEEVFPTLSQKLESIEGVEYFIEEDDDITWYAFTDVVSPYDIASTDTYDPVQLKVIYSSAPFFFSI
jgi:hypothetical protein